VKVRIPQYSFLFLSPIPPHSLPANDAIGQDADLEAELEALETQMLEEDLLKTDAVPQNRISQVRRIGSVLIFTREY
jgi:hypothetical protein